MKKNDIIITPFHIKYYTISHKMNFPEEKWTIFRNKNKTKSA